MPHKLNPLITFFCTLIILCSCQKELSFTGEVPIVDTIGNNTPAVFTFMGAPANCLNPLIQGIYRRDTLLTVANTVTLQVNVTKTGTYSIATAVVNGLTFAAQDTFSITGLQKVVLNGSGKAIASGTFDFTPGNGGCTFSITIADPPPTYNCKDCIYFPICVGSKYSYYDTTLGTASIRNADILNSVDTVIGMLTYKKLFFNTDIGYYNCSNGETIASGYHVVSVNGTPTLEFYKSHPLKANAAVGDTWADTLRASNGQTVIQNLTLEAKGISRTIGTFNFTDVIVVSIENGLVTPPTGYTPVTRSKYYFAKGVGLVEVHTIKMANGQTTYHSAIKSYFIP